MANAYVGFILVVFATNSLAHFVDVTTPGSQVSDVAGLVLLKENTLTAHRKDTSVPLLFKHLGFLGGKSGALYSSHGSIDSYPAGAFYFGQKQTGGFYPGFLDAHKLFSPYNTGYRPVSLYDYGFYNRNPNIYARSINKFVGIEGALVNKELITININIPGTKPQPETNEISKIKNKITPVQKAPQFTKKANLETNMKSSSSESNQGQQYYSLQTGSQKKEKPKTLTYKNKVNNNIKTPNDSQESNLSSQEETEKLQRSKNQRQYTIFKGEQHYTAEKQQKQNQEQERQRNQEQQQQEQERQRKQKQEQERQRQEQERQRQEQERQRKQQEREQHSNYNPSKIRKMSIKKDSETKKFTEENEENSQVKFSRERKHGGGNQSETKKFFKDENDKSKNSKEYTRDQLEQHKLQVN